ncbi:hypothetical protein BDP27DRAFT_1346572 [Rhodocollybia butyracea]|uniref:Uncharacterized protein n=1 Tax=Rhodocollybia butyracea TaxID=206335 RepID=A0A9P5P750_9AGAR|nr:hypothetical protein BDP27DRAFT_1346572 [Rhodocollybia butyracea]
MSERLISPNVAGRSRLEEGVLRVAQIFRALRVCLKRSSLVLHRSVSYSTPFITPFSVSSSHRPDYSDKAVFRAHSIIKFTHNILEALEPPKHQSFFSVRRSEIGLHIVVMDLRQPNVLLLPEGGFNLIDFDWCGELGKAVYPADILLDDTLGDRHEGTQRHGLSKRTRCLYVQVPHWF